MFYGKGCVGLGDLTDREAVDLVSLLALLENEGSSCLSLLPDSLVWLWPVGQGWELLSEITLLSPDIGRDSCQLLGLYLEHGGVSALQRCGIHFASSALCYEASEDLSHFIVGLWISSWVVAVFGWTCNF